MEKRKEKTTADERKNELIKGRNKRRNRKKDVEEMRETLKKKRK